MLKIIRSFRVENEPLTINNSYFWWWGREEGFRSSNKKSILFNIYFLKLRYQKHGKLIPI